MGASQAANLQSVLPASFSVTTSDAKELWLAANPISKARVSAFFNSPQQRTAERCQELHDTLQQDISLYLNGITALARETTEEASSSQSFAVSLGSVSRAGFEAARLQQPAPKKLTVEDRSWHGRLLCYSYIVAAICTEVALQKGLDAEVAFASGLLAASSKVMPAWHAETEKAAKGRKVQSSVDTLIPVFSTDRLISQQLLDHWNSCFTALELPVELAAAQSPVSPYAPIVDAACQLSETLLFKAQDIYETPLSELDNQRSWKEIQRHFLKFTEHYRRSEPRLSTQISTIVFQRIKVGSDRPLQSHLLLRYSPAATKLEDDAQLVFQQAWEAIVKGFDPAVLVPHACDVCLPKAGFPRGVVYRLEKERGLAHPTLTVGAGRLQDYQPVDIQSGNTANDALRIALLTGKTVTNREARLCGFSASFIVCPLGPVGSGLVLAVEKNPQRARNPQETKAALEASVQLLCQLLGL